MINHMLIFKLALILICLASTIFLVLPFGYTFQNYQLSKTPQTYLDLNKILCLEANSVKVTNCPDIGIVTVEPGGRLGNQIWEYISVWVVAKKTGLQPFIPECIKLTMKVLFSDLSIPTLKEIGHCPVHPNVNIRNMKDYNFTTKKSIILEKYNTQPELLSEYIKDVIEELSIKKNLLVESQKILHSIVKSLNRKVDNFIGVHIRRTDYLKFVRTKYKVKPAGIGYFISAIDYFEKKYNNSAFVVITDDPLWCKKKFNKFPNVFVDNKLDQNDSPELDMALMASCNHSIIDYGTFGQWGALLAGGETIYFKTKDGYSSERLDKVMSKWHTLP